MPHVSIHVHMFRLAFTDLLLAAASWAGQSEVSVCSALSTQVNVNSLNNKGLK